MDLKRVVYYNRNLLHSCGRGRRTNLCVEIFCEFASRSNKMEECESRWPKLSNQSLRRLMTFYTRLFWPLLDAHTKDLHRKVPSDIGGSSVVIQPVYFFKKTHSICRPHSPCWRREGQLKVNRVAKQNFNFWSPWHKPPDYSDSFTFMSHGSVGIVQKIEFLNFHDIFNQSVCRQRF